MDVACEVPLSFVALLGGAARSTPGRASSPYLWLCGRLRAALTGPVNGGWIPVEETVASLPSAARAFLRGVEERLSSLHVPSGPGRRRSATPERLAAFLGTTYESGDSFLAVVRRWVVSKVVEADAFPRRKPAGAVRRWAHEVFDGWLRRLRARIRPKQWDDDGTFASLKDVAALDDEDGEEVVVPEKKPLTWSPGSMRVSFGEPEEEFHDWTDELDGPDPDDVIERF